MNCVLVVIITLFFSNFAFAAPLQKKNPISLHNNLLDNLHNIKLIEYNKREKEV